MEMDYRLLKTLWKEDAIFIVVLAILVLGMPFVETFQERFLLLSLLGILAIFRSFSKMFRKEKENGD